MPHTNAFGQPIGFPLPDWQARPLPGRSPLQGQYCRVEPLTVDHAPDLFAAYQADASGQMWTYLSYGPFASVDELASLLAKQQVSQDPLFHAIIDLRTGKAVGVASYLRIDPANGVIEVGWISYAPALQRTPAATEAMYLLMRRAFDELGYRRYEWKCDSLNAPSRRAAQRLGFTFEGIFRQAIVYRERNRDTAWYSILDSEWPTLKQAFTAWLEPANFDEAGQQRVGLETLRTKGTPPL